MSLFTAQNSESSPSKKAVDCVMHCNAVMHRFRMF